MTKDQIIARKDFILKTAWIKTFLLNTLFRMRGHVTGGFLLCGRDAIIRFQNDSIVYVIGRWCRIGYDMI